MYASEYTGYASVTSADRLSFFNLQLQIASIILIVLNIKFRTQKYGMIEKNNDTFKNETKITIDCFSVQNNGFIQEQNMP